MVRSHHIVRQNTMARIVEHLALIAQLEFKIWKTKFIFAQGENNKMMNFLSLNEYGKKNIT